MFPGNHHGFQGLQVLCETSRGDVFQNHGQAMDPPPAAYSDPFQGVPVKELEDGCRLSYGSLMKFWLGEKPGRSTKTQKNYVRCVR